MRFAILFWAAAACAQPFHFEFGSAKGRIGASAFEPGSAVECAPNHCGSEKPFFFSTDVPEGDYDVTLDLAGGMRGARMTVRAESRRLLVENLDVAPGSTQTRAFTVNVRYPEIATGDMVKLKPRERGSFSWDHKLTLEFNGEHPAVRSIDVVKANKPITVYLAGDSTVVDQDREPWAAWGQMLPRFFKQGVSIANHAESGESLKSFIGERRLAKILTTIKEGDYLFVQFTHNDQKPGGSYVEPFTTYKDHLKLFIREARARKATPVLVTSMHRRTFSEDGKITNSLGDYPEAMRQTAHEEGVPLIDLNAMSERFYEAMGPAGSIKAFVHYPVGTFPGQRGELKDNTHFNAYGAYQLAKCVIEGIKTAKLDLARYLVDAGPFDPSKPDPVEAFRLPLSPLSTAVAPEGT